MKVVVFGATGNVGSSVVAALATDPRVDEIVGVARRPPGNLTIDKVRWTAADITTSSLEPIVDGADAVVDLAWKIQPSRDVESLRRTNIDGTARLVEACAHRRVPTLVYASSVGAYSPDDDGRKLATPVPRDEHWPTRGIGTSVYSRQKARIERFLDDFERTNAEMRIVRLRTALVFQRHAASEIARYFLGRLAPVRMIGRRRLSILPGGRYLQLQVVHASDAARAYVAAVHSEDRGAYNIAAPEVVDFESLAELLGSRPMSVSPRLLRNAVAVSHFLRVQPTAPGWVDLALQVPMMDTSAARRDLGWSAEQGSIDTLAELLDGFAIGAGTSTAPLEPTRTMLPFLPEARADEVLDQASYLQTLAQEAGVDFDASMTKAEASKEIDRLQQQTGRGDD